jgi:hypothetical protein
MVGAGLSCSLGLPNTASLVSAVMDAYSRGPAWCHSRPLERLSDSFKFYYPDGGSRDFRPDAVDFFSSLKTYIDTAEGLRGGFKDAPELYRALKFAIARELIERLRRVDAHLAAGGHPYLDRIVQPGNIVVTSNWDIAVSDAAMPALADRGRGLSRSAMRSNMRERSNRWSSTSQGQARHQSPRRVIEGRSMLCPGAVDTRSLFLRAAWRRIR